MPIYEFQCRDCGNTIETFVHSSDQKNTLRCPHCQSRNLEKMISLPSLVAKKNQSEGGRTCCGKEERCSTPPCTDNNPCRRDEKK
jgi:putative FmdB family regulatory protein